MQSVSKPPTVCNCFSVHCNHELKLLTFFQEFVLHINCPDLDFELGGKLTVNIMSMRDASGLKCDAREHEAPEGGAI